MSDSIKSNQDYYVDEYGNIYKPGTLVFLNDRWHLPINLTRGIYLDDIHDNIKLCVVTPTVNYDHE